jgi:hypothetical protein
MATITLASDTNVSALSLANNDTIDLAGFVLTFDAQPAVTGIQVTSPGTVGTVVFPVACLIPTWDFFAGTTTMILTLPADCEIGSVTGGTLTNRRGIATNNGVVGTAIGGAGPTAAGILTNNGVVGTAIGGAGTGAIGISTNNGTVIRSVGGAGTGANGISTNSGVCLRLTNNSNLGVAAWNGNTCFVEGPFIDGTIPGNIKNIYSLGVLSGDAIIAVDATVIELSEGGGAAFQLVGGGGLVY